MDKYNELLERIKRIDDAGKVEETDDVISYATLLKIINKETEDLREIFLSTEFNAKIKEYFISKLPLLKRHWASKNIAVKSYKYYDNGYLQIICKCSKIGDNFKEVKIFDVCQDLETGEWFSCGNNEDPEIINKFHDDIEFIFATLAKFPSNQVDFDICKYRFDYLDNKFKLDLDINGNVSYGLALEDFSDDIMIFQRNWLNKPCLANIFKEKENTIYKNIPVEVCKLPELYQKLIGDYRSKQESLARVLK